MPKTNRPFNFRQDIADEICQFLTVGRSIRQICQDTAMPTQETVYLWLRNNEEFAQNYARAKDWYADAVFDKCQQIAEDAKTPDEIAAARLQIDTLKWALGRMKPKKYGDKLQVGGAEDLPPVKTQSTIDVSGLSLEQLEALHAAFSGKKDGE